MDANVRSIRLKVTCKDGPSGVRIDCWPCLHPLTYTHGI